MAGRLLDTIKRNWNVELVLPKFPRLLPEKAKHAAGKEYERSLTLFDLVTMLAAVLFLIAALVLPPLPRRSALSSCGSVSLRRPMS